MNTYPQGAKMQAMINEIDEKHLTDRFKEGLTSHALSNFRSDFKPPIEFIDDQPMPMNGLLLYGGCFSNHFQWVVPSFVQIDILKMIFF